MSSGKLYELLIQYEVLDDGANPVELKIRYILFAASRQEASVKATTHLRANVRFVRSINRVSSILDEWPTVDLR